MTVLGAPAAWIRRIVCLRERAEFGIDSCLMVIAFVSCGRILLESLLCRQPMIPSTVGWLNMVGFYFSAFFIFSLLASRLGERPPEKVGGVVAVAIFLGLFPPVIDLFLVGQGQCFYRYIVPTQWSWSLFDRTLNTPGEPIIVWTSIFLMGVYVRVVGGSYARFALALGLAYVAFFFIAGVPMHFGHYFENQLFAPYQQILPDGTLALTTENATGFSAVALATLISLLTAEACYLGMHPKLARHLLRRMIHAAPYGATVLLGAAFARLFLSSEQFEVARAPLFLVINVVSLLQVCAIALIQNDHFDAIVEGQSPAPGAPSREDVRFFSALGVVWCAVVLSCHRPIGLLLLLFFVVSIVYSYDFYRGKRFFPANYKSEGVWGAVAFLLGVYTYLRPGTEVPLSIVVVSFLAFGGASIFNAFKDYKDIRVDRRVGNQTLYVLAHRAGWRLSRVHTTLRYAFVAAVLLPPWYLVTYSVSAVGIAAVTLPCAAAADRVLSGPPVRRTVLQFFVVMTVYFAALAVVIDFAR